MAKPIDFSKLSQRAQEFFRNRASSKKAKAKSKSKGGSKGGGGGS